MAKDNNPPFPLAFTCRNNGIANTIITSVLIFNRSENTQLEVKAVWDTGATGSAINKELVPLLKLKPFGLGQHNTANGPGECGFYLIDIALPNNVRINDIQVIDANLCDTQMLIGMDIISQGQFCISNVNGKTTASFVMPAVEETDYVKKVIDTQISILKNRGLNSPCPCGSGKKVKHCCLKALQENGITTRQS